MQPQVHVRSLTMSLSSPTRPWPQVINIDNDANWFTAEQDGRTGFVPANYLEMQPHEYVAASCLQPGGIEPGRVSMCVRVPVCVCLCAGVCVCVLWLDSPRGDPFS